MGIFKKTTTINTKKPKKWKNQKDWAKMDKYIKKHKLKQTDFED